MLGAHSKTWWKVACTVTATASWEAAATGSDNATQTALQLTLKWVTKKVKWVWADKAVTEGNVWDVAKWRHGRKLSTISALQDPGGDLTFKPADMAHILAWQFFTQEPGNIVVSQPDDPPPQPQHEFAPFMPWELNDLLCNMSSLSVPGFSGLSWAILKLAWGDIDEHFQHLADTCVTVR